VLKTLADIPDKLGMYVYVTDVLLQKLRFVLVRIRLQQEKFAS
jgi:hypothetical protein